MAYDPSEQKDIERVFLGMLRGATRDGGAKRARGEKPPWYTDGSHEAAMFSHINKWKHGERKDPESGAHPLVHLAWRALAIAWQESVGQVAPSPGVELLPNTDARLPQSAAVPFCDICDIPVVGLQGPVMCGRRKPCPLHCTPGRPGLGR